MHNFKYDPREALMGKPFLSPVYFNVHVLTRYFYDERFYCEFSSDTYGSVYGSDFSMSFGINQNGSVIAWLGDLEKLPASERNYWIIENKESDHDIASEFYDGQIECLFTDPPMIIRCLNELVRFNSNFFNKYGVSLYKKRSVAARIEEARRYKRLLLKNIDDFKRFISELNEIVNENVDVSAIRSFLDGQSISYVPELKGNKLLERVYLSVLQDTNNLIAPFFYLYDLRLWADHATGDDIVNKVANSLGCSQPYDYQQFMESLIIEIHASLCSLLEKISN